MPVSVRYSSSEVGIATAPLPDDPPVHTGHLGFLGDAGYLHLCGRGEMFIRGTYPAASPTLAELRAFGALWEKEEQR